MLRHGNRQVKMARLGGARTNRIENCIMRAKPAAETVQSASSGDDYQSWLTREPSFVTTGGGLDSDVAALKQFSDAGDGLLQLSTGGKGLDHKNLDLTRLIKDKIHDVRAAFLRVHAEAVYSSLTDTFAQPVRIQSLVDTAVRRYPGLLPSASKITEDATRSLKEKEGHERAIGLLLSHIFANPRAGIHLLQSMLRPLPDSVEETAKFSRDGVLDLGAAVLRRTGKAAELLMYNPEYLNAEDASTIGPMEQAVDVAILDPITEVCVLRGTPAQHPRYAGRNIFCSGLNLTHLYEGKIPYLWYLTRDLGFVNKIAHGLLDDPDAIDDPMPTVEKPWIAAVETFAIGGGCQYLLVMDYTLAEKSAYLTLPARKEGIIPGLTNMRLPRFVGDRITRQAILFDRRLEADSPEGRMIVDQIVPDGEMSSAVEATVQKLTSSGSVSTVGNRKALRVCQESLDDVRRYMASYAREQVKCHLSPALVRNLEDNWLKPKGKL
ncbi:MAG TPA: enoyl-CoA hydratase/isomerase family protein [Alphaproteobacteria bacterium]|nr:enoyl-CoA hydratase/isomerase family protein [Alphaproteobacteria bacterium]HIB57554.1 enoyl-CoA hydratase/isomerase family protein [Alphaproteobacteria bacterium]HIN92133.1 enoyl-CoA hydratase/isomerase family protein [Alphaproteobacteria bacterium]